MPKKWVPTNYTSRQLDTVDQRFTPFISICLFAEGAPCSQLSRSLRSRWDVLNVVSEKFLRVLKSNTNVAVHWLCCIEGGLFVGLPEEIPLSTMVTEDDLKYYVSQYKERGFRSQDQFWKKLVFVSPRWVNNCLVFCPAGDRWTGTATWTWTGSGCVLDQLKRFVTASTYNWGFQKYGSQFLPVEWKITEWGYYFYERHNIALINFDIQSHYFTVSQTFSKFVIMK